MRSKDFAAITILTGHGRTANGLDLIDSWSAHVVRFALESGASEPSGTDWGVHDYIAALYIRDQVRLCVHQVTPTKEDAPFTVQAADELLRSFTVPDIDERLRHVANDVPRSPWWWGRIPSSGPVARDLEA
jgi:hypothetical protein